MNKELISIQEAAKLTGKSIQTIRRAVKAKKFSVKREKTPQGFNYKIDKTSLLDVYKIKQNKEKVDLKNKEPKNKKKLIKIDSEKKQDMSLATKQDLNSLSNLLEKMITQHSEERQSFLRLVNTLNDKVFSLESQIKLLAEPKTAWYKFWK